MSIAGSINNKTQETQLQTACKSLTHTVAYKLFFFLFLNFTLFSLAVLIPPSFFVFTLLFSLTYSFALLFFYSFTATLISLEKGGYVFPSTVTLTVTKETLI